MRNHKIVDKTTRCATCGKRFTLTAGEQELCMLRGTQHSTSCPSCARRLRLPVCSVELR
jgi:Probable zinc-ribbon domain